MTGIHIFLTVPATIQMFEHVLLGDCASNNSGTLVSQLLGNPPTTTTKFSFGAAR